MDIGAIWIEIAFPNTRPIILCHGYKQEWMTACGWSEKIKASFEMVFTKNKEVHITSDLNIDWKDMDSSEYHPWKEQLSCFQLEQTRVSETTSTLIDHIF